MSRVSFENSGRRAVELADPTQMAARYRIQKDAERRIVPDVVTKLSLVPEDSLLELGCNVGTLLIPLSFLVREVVGIDHPNCLERLRQCHDGANVRLIGGNFLDIDVERKFDKVLCYDVLHYLQDVEEVLRFMDKAVDLLAPGGQALFGDIPNASLKERFLQSSFGRDFVRQWEAARDTDARDDLEYDRSLPPDDQLVRFDDELVLTILDRYRGQGFHAYALPQTPDLPFGNTREDILIVRVK